MTASDHPPPNEFVVALCALAPGQVTALAQRLADRHGAELRTKAEAGAALFPFQDTVTGAPFYLGEIPLARASVSLGAPRGESVHGAAVVMGRDAKFAICLAVLDGVFRHALDGSRDVEALLEAGRTILAKTQTQRSTIRQRTRVAFSTMDGG